MLKRARTEAAELLAGLPVRRSPAVRRAIPDGWMLACDLPQCAEAETIRAFQQRAEAAGWRTECRDGWLLLDKPSVLSAETEGDAGASEEKDCVFSLLRRHPGFRDDPAVLRTLAKLSELSPAAAEPEYRKLHRELAVRLRLRPGRCPIKNGGVCE